MARLPSLLLSLLLLLLSASFAGSQTLSTTVPLRANCGTLTNVTANTSLCKDTTLGVLMGYEGTGWQSDAALATKVIIVTDPRWGAKADGGVTDNAPAFTAAIAAAGVGGKIVVPAGSNYYGFLTGITMNVARQVLEGQGDRTMLVNQHTGGQALITVNGAQGVHLKHFSYGGVAGAGHGISITNGAHRGIIEDVYARQVGTTADGINISSGLGWTIIQPRFTVNMGAYPFTITNPGGIRSGIRSASGGGVGTQTIIGPVIEGVLDWGIHLNSENDTIIGGTIEGNAGGNIRLAGNSIKVYGTNAEVGGDADAGGVYVNGNGHVLSGMLTAGATPNDAKLELVGADWTLIENSRFNTITVDSASKFNKFQNVWHGTNGGTFTDSGSGTVIENLHNSSNANQRRSDKRASSPINYARNGGFERWVSATSLDAAYAGGWSLTGSATLVRAGDGESDTEKFAGHYAVKVTAAANTTSGLLYQGPVPRAINNEAIGVTASVWAKAETGTTTFNIIINQAGAEKLQSFTATTTWTKFSATFPFASATAFDIRFIITEASEVLYLDNFFLADGFATQLGDWDNVKLQEPEPTGRTTTTFSATPTFYGNQATLHVITLTANVTGITLSNWISGLPVRLLFTQDGTGGRTVAGWPAAVKWNAATAPTVTATAGASTLVTLVYDGTNYWGDFVLDLR